MMSNGFSFLEIRKMYIDEFYAYHFELLYTLEKQGKLKAGTYDRIVIRTERTGVDETLKLLKQQVSNVIKKK